MYKINIMEINKNEKVKRSAFEFLLIHYGMFFA